MPYDNIDSAQHQNTQLMSNQNIEWTWYGKNMDVGLNFIENRLRQLKSSQPLIQSHFKHRFIPSTKKECTKHLANRRHIKRTCLLPLSEFIKNNIAQSFYQSRNQYSSLSCVRRSIFTRYTVFTKRSYAIWTLAPKTGIEINLVSVSRK